MGKSIFSIFIDIFQKYYYNDAYINTIICRRDCFDNSVLQSDRIEQDMLMERLPYLNRKINTGGKKCKVQESLEDWIH